jgi:hypothetical protein
MSYIQMIGLSVIARTGLYLILALIFAFLAYAYHYGYRNLRSTPIINSLHRLFFWQSVFFFYMAFLPIFKITAPVYYQLGTELITIMLMPVAISAHLFWSESFKKQEQLPPRKIKGGYRRKPESED